MKVASEGADINEGVSHTAGLVDAVRYDRAVQRLSEVCFFFQAEDGIRDVAVTGVQTCALPILLKVFAEVFRTFNKASKPFKIASFVKPPCDCAVARAALYLNALSLMTEESGAAKASILASSGTAEKSVCLASRA